MSRRIFGERKKLVQKVKMNNFEFFGLVLVFAQRIKFRPLMEIEKFFITKMVKKLETIEKKKIAQFIDFS